jgi:hypothetical protein
MMSSAQSDSTLTCGRPQSDNNKGARGHFTWIVEKFVTAVVSRMPAAEMVRSASSVLRSKAMQDRSYGHLHGFLQSAHSLFGLGDADRNCADLSKNSSMQTLDMND